MMQYWLFKTEPSTWSWQQQIARGTQGEHWDGVRNYQANNNMKAMVLGDMGFFYHSVNEKQIMGTVRVSRLHYPDPSDAQGRFGMVDVVAVAQATHFVTLSEVKARPDLADMILVRMSRLSVQPVRPREWEIICEMAGLDAQQREASAGFLAK